jgi:membrane protease YdiL (CAAX protease family)
VRALALLGLVAALLVATALASPWVYWALTGGLARPFTFSRVWNRVFEVLLVAGLLAAWRRLDLGAPRQIGLRDAHAVRQLGRGLAIGAVAIAAGLAFCWLAGGLVPALRYPAGKTLRKAALGVLAAVLVGVGEEALFRGVLLRRLTRDAGRTAGVVATTAIYAAVHAIGHVASTRGPVHVWSGVERTATLFAPLADPRQLPELCGLFAFGLVLAAARLRSGSLWLPIGIHAAWVAAFRVGRLFFAIRPRPAWVVGPGWPPLVGGAAGWVAIGVLAWLLLRRRR